MVFEDQLEETKHQLLKPFSLSISSALSIAIAVTIPPVYAEDAHLKEPFPTPTSIAESPISSSSKPTITSGLAIESKPAIKPDPVIEQAARLLTEPPITARSIEAVELSRLSPAIAQTETPNPQPTEPISEPASSDSLQRTPTDRWQFSATPYLFVPFSVKADATVAGRSAAIDLGLGSLLNFDRVFDAGLRLEARKNRWGLILDGFYVFARQSGNLGVSFPPGSLQGFGINTGARVSADGSVSVHQGTLDVAASYRVIDTSLGRPTATSNFYPRLFVAPILGLRANFWGQRLVVDTIRIGNIPLAVDQDFSFTRTTIEPLIGAQVGLDLSERWAVGIRGDVSGFNINADRDITWNLLLDARYHLSPSTALQLAYRFNGFDFEDGAGFRRSKLNLRQNGLLLGVIFRF